jgi:membrane protein DedA with SNARE-associated domain
MLHYIDFLSLIDSYGYLAVFIGSVFEGEIIVFLGGLLSYQGNFNFIFVIILAFLGAIIGDMFWFLLGRYQGIKIINRFKWVRERTEKSLLYVEKNSRNLAFTMRFLYGFKSIIPFTLGITKIQTKTFFYFNTVGAFLWTILVVAFGYLFGGIIETILGKLRNHQVIFVIIVILVFVLANLLFKFIEYIIKKIINNFK